MFIKWLKLKQKSKVELKQEPISEGRFAPPITSMMVPEPGAIIGGKRGK